MKDDESFQDMLNRALGDIDTLAKTLLEARHLKLASYRSFPKPSDKPTPTLRIVK